MYIFVFHWRQDANGCLFTSGRRDLTKANCAMLLAKVTIEKKKFLREQLPCVARVYSFLVASNAEFSAV